MREPNTIWKCAECGIIFEALQPCEKGDDCIPVCWQIILTARARSMSR